MLEREVRRKTMMLENHHRGDGGSQCRVEELPQLRYENLAVATNFFNESNKLGKGGFGQVYKVMVTAWKNTLFHNQMGYKQNLDDLPGKNERWTGNSCKKAFTNFRTRLARVYK